jgi:hypothetical protein
MRFCPNCRKSNLDSPKRAQMLCKFRLSFQRRRCCGAVRGLDGGYLLAFQAEYKFRVPRKLSSPTMF